MNLYTAQQKQNITSLQWSQTKMSSVDVCTVQSPCQHVAECWVDCSRLVVQRHRNFWSSRYGIDVGVGRTKLTAPRVVGDELAFLRQVRRGAKVRNLPSISDPGRRWRTLVSKRNNILEIFFIPKLIEISPLTLRTWGSKLPPPQRAARLCCLPARAAAPHQKYRPIKGWVLG